MWFEERQEARDGAAGDGAGAAAGASAPLLEPGAPRSSSPFANAGPVTTAAAAAAARPKSKLATASGFFDAPPPPPPPLLVPARGARAAWRPAAMGARLRRGADACWDSGMLCAVVSYIMFSLSAFCVKLTNGRIPVLQLCLVRSGLSFTMTVVLMKGMHMSPLFGHRANAPLLVARGVCGAMSMAVYYASLQLLPLGDAVTVGLISPPLTAVLARLVLKEPLGVRGGLGCLISLAGVVFVCQPPFLFHAGAASLAPAATSARMLGAACGLASAVLGSCSQLTIRKLGNAERAPVIAMAFHTATLCLSVWPLAFGWPQKARAASIGDAALLVAVAVTSFFAQLLITRSLQRMAAARVSAVSFTQVVYSYMLSAAVFHEGISLVSAVGVLCTLAGVVLVVLRHGPAPGAAGAAARPPVTRATTLARSPSPLEPSLAEQVLLKQAAAAAARQPGDLGDGGAQEAAAPGEAAASDAGASRLLAPQRSLRALVSLHRATAEAASIGGSGARQLLRNISQAASAHMATAPSSSAADLALAAEGACGACAAVFAASTVAFEAFVANSSAGGGAPSQDGAAGLGVAAAEGAAQAVDAAFAGDRAAAAAEGEALIPAGTLLSHGSERGSRCSEPGAAWRAAADGDRQAAPVVDGSGEGSAVQAPRMSSHLSAALDGGT